MSYIGQRPVVGRYIKLDQISSGFNGSNTGFSMTAGSQAVFPGTARNLLLSLGGVIQEPDTDFTISGSTLTFTTPPVANTTFFGVIYGDMQATGTPSDGTVLPASIASSGHFKIPQLTVNEDGADVDFRVEGNGEPNLLFVDASTDRIGIGTNSPSSPLEVSSATNPVIKATSSSSSVGAGFFAQGGSSNDSQFQLNSGTTAKYTFLRDGSQSDDLRIYDSANALDIIRYRHGSYLHFGVNGSERLRISSSGNVGIGTTSPTTKFHVLDTSKTSTTARDNTIARFLSNASNADCNIQLSNGVDHSAQLGIVGNGAEFYIAQDGAERFRINSSGEVGIGTTSPGQLLSIKNTNAQCQQSLTAATNGSCAIYFGDTDSVNRSTIIHHNTGDYLSFGTAATERMRIDSSGRVLIGTTTEGHSTADDLTVASSGHTGITIRSGSSNNGNIYFSDATTGNAELSGYIQYSHSNNSMLFGTAESNAMLITSNKNISFNGSSAAACDIDIEGNQVDIGNPLGNGVSNGINPTFRALVVNKNIVFSSMWGGDNQLHKHLQFSGGSNIFYVGTNDAEIARTNANGLVVGSTSFDSNNSIGVRIFAHGAIHSTRDSEYAYVGRRSNSNGGMFLFRRDSTDVGNISVTTSATSYNSGSDYRLKQDDTPLIDGLTRLKQLKPIKFKWKNDTSQFVDGFFAHEVSSIVPNAITGEKDAVYEKDDELGHKKGDPIYQQIDHGKLVPLLVAALQEEIVKREELEARVAALEAA